MKMWHPCQCRFLQQCFNQQGNNDFSPMMGLRRTLLVLEVHEWVLSKKKRKLPVVNRSEVTDVVLSSVLGQFLFLFLFFYVFLFSFSRSALLSSQARFIHNMGKVNKIEALKCPLCKRRLWHFSRMPNPQLFFDSFIRHSTFTAQHSPLLAAQ